MKCQMLSPWENKKKYFKIWYDKTFTQSTCPHLFDVCTKFNTVGLKGEGFSQTLQDVFLLLLICLTLKYFICDILIKRMLGFKV